ncbi:L,D-transpeptidase [Streptomyces sp. NPDC058657]|uniref:L,D-transpeptidase n=1 Tax=unclassified Streptomyces TaxID=2593676 RepID=UPI00364604CF
MPGWPPSHWTTSTAVVLSCTLFTGVAPAAASDVTSAATSDAPPAAARVAPGCHAPTGPYQWQLEKKLKLPEDGRMSEADCFAIKRLQTRLKITPVNGAADLRTYRLLLVDEVKKNPNANKRCPTPNYRLTCVDLSRQILWVQKGKKVTFSPIPIRSGRKGLETRTGWQRIYQKKRSHFSTIYDGAPMPYSQFFNGGQALHGTYRDLFTSGSGGCINMYLKDAERLYKYLKVGARLYIYGRKPVRSLETSTAHDDRLIAEAFGAEGIPGD